MYYETESSFRFRRRARLKTKMSLFFHFLLFYDTIDDEKTARRMKKRIFENMLEGKEWKSL